MVTLEGRKKENSKFCTLPKFEILFFCPFRLVVYIIGLMLFSLALILIIVTFFYCHNMAYKPEVCSFVYY